MHIKILTTNKKNILGQTYSDKSQCKGVMKNLLKGVTVGPNDMCLLNGDNIGFTMKGEKASYSQWVLF